MQDDYRPILFDTDGRFDEIEVIPIHDLHVGNKCFSEKLWYKMKKYILERENRFVIFAGDMMENAIPGSKSDVFTQKMNPYEQKEFFAEQLADLKGRVLCITDGNHERNRSTKSCGLYPLYDCAQIAGIPEVYRPHFAFIDIGVGSGGHGDGKQVHYVGYVIHQAKDLKNFSSADTIDGIDFMVYGHDHDPKDHPRSKLCYDAKNKFVTQKDVEVINCGSYMNYGGYAADGAYRPLASKKYSLILDGKTKSVSTRGFHL